MEKTGFSLEDRVLCSDDGCIGTVGSDGRCKVCGLQYSGNEAIPTTEGSTEILADAPELPLPTETEEDPAADSSDERVCCSDETCIGIIGKDGKCGTCGLAFSPINQ